MTQHPHQPPGLSTIHVRWSPDEAAYLAWSDADPGRTCTDPWSSLAAMDALLDAITS